jgi:3-oxoacyl-[acyl-carrier protein] reductase
MDLGLDGRRALVVGGSAGIGYQTALQLAAEGADVTIAARDEGNLLRASERIHEETGDAVGWFTVDVTADDAEPRLTEGFGGGALDVLIITVGGSIRGEFESHDDENWRSNYDTNVLGPVRTVRALLPAVRAGSDPSVVILGAASSKMPYQNQVVSNVHKTGLLALVKTLALELAPDVRVNAVCPGRTLTRLWLDRADQMAAASGTTPEEILSEFSEEIPLSRMAQPAEIAAAVVFMASPRAGYITGQNLTVDGGIGRGLL